MADNDATISLELSLLECQFLTVILRGIVELDDDDASDAARAMARSIVMRMVDTAIMEGKVPMEDLPPAREED